MFVSVMASGFQRLSGNPAWSHLCYLFTLIASDQYDMIYLKWIAQTGTVLCPEGVLILNMTHWLTTLLGKRKFKSNTNEQWSNSDYTDSLSAQLNCLILQSPVICRNSSLCVSPMQNHLSLSGYMRNSVEIVEASYWMFLSSWITSSWLLVSQTSGFPFPYVLCFKSIYIFM